MKQSPDPMKKPRKEQELMTDPQEQRQSFPGSIPSSDQSKDETRMAQSSADPIHPIEKNCQFYLNTGQCPYRRNCHLNHPTTTLPQELPEKTNVELSITHPSKGDCYSYFRTGRCRRRKRCTYNHHNKLPKELRKRACKSTSQSATDSRQGFEASGSKRPRIPVNPSVNAQENLHEQRQENIKRQRSEGQETLQQQGLMMSEMPESHNVEAHYQGNTEEQRQREIERMRLRRLRVAQGLPEMTNVRVCKYFPKGTCMKGSDCLYHHAMNRDGSEPMRQSTTSQRTNESRQGFEASGFRRPRTPVNPRVNDQVNMQQQRLMRDEMPENHNVDEAHDQGNTEEQRKKEIERMRSEARLRLDQMRPTALFDEASVPREVMKEFGFKDAEGF